MNEVGFGTTRVSREGEERSSIAGALGRLLQRIPVIETLQESLQDSPLLKIVFVAVALALGTLLVSNETVGAWMLAAALLFSIVIYVRPETDRYTTINAILTIIVSVSALAYLAWRTSAINLGGWWVSIPLFLAELFGALHLIGFYYTMQPRKQVALRVQDDPTQFPIFIFIPTVNEGTVVLRPTIRGAIAARDRYRKVHPHARVRIVVCNDGFVAGVEAWRDVERLAAQLGVECITRKVKGGAKAGNIEHARQAVGATNDALIVIFDADQVAHPDFLLKTVPPFADRSIGWVQTGQYYRNLDNPVAMWANDQQAMFYKLICPGKSTLNSVIICGTNVMIRARALDEIGGLPQDNVTEDMAASIRLHGRWRSLFLPDRLATGLGPMDMYSYFAQQRRWAIGNLSVLRDNWKRIFVPWHGDLSPAQRVQYFLACTHYLSGVRDLVYVLTPLIYLLFGVSAIDYTSIGTFLRYALPYWVLSQFAFWIVIRGKTGLRGVMLTFVSFPIFITSLLTVITGKKIGFHVTAKNRTRSNRLRLIRVHLLILAVSMIAIAVGLSRLHTNPAPILMSLFWVVFEMVYLGSAVWLAAADATSDIRWPQSLRRVVRLVYCPLHVVQRVMPFTGAALVMTMLLFTMPALARIVPGAHSGSVSAAASAPQLNGGAPYVTITLPYRLLETRRENLKALINSDYAIVGRTFITAEQFDRAWAGELASHNVIPWVTLLFSTPPEPVLANTDIPGKKGDATASSAVNITANITNRVARTLQARYVNAEGDLENTLLAIGNGACDQDIRRWARQIRDYGLPIYLTLFPNVDRVWGLPSALTDGSMPGDVARAWARVRAIFKDEQALNVAWVWAPFDPLNDTAFVPPPGTYDVVLFKMNKAHDTPWSDVTAAVNAVRQQHPGASLFFDITLPGVPMAKASYLPQILNAVGKEQTRGFVFIR